MGFSSKASGGSGTQLGGVQTPSNTYKNWGQRALEWQQNYGAGADGGNTPVNQPQQNSALQGMSIDDLQKLLDRYLVNEGIKDQTVKPAGTKVSY